MNGLPTRPLRRFALAMTAVPLLAAPDARCAPVESQAQVLIQAPVDRVWQLLTQIDQWPRWNTAVQSAQLSGGLAVGSTFVWRSGGFTVTSTLQEVDAHRRLVWTGRAFGTQAVHFWELSETPAGVEVRTSETFTGWLPRLMPGTMQEKLDSTLPLWLSALKLAAEAKGGPRSDAPNLPG